MSDEATIQEPGRRGNMQLREAARKALAKYEWGIGLDNKVTEARIRPFSFHERASALNLRRTYPRGFEPAATPEPAGGLEKPAAQPGYSRGPLGWLQRIVAGTVISRLKHSETDWWFLARNSLDIRREMLRDLVVIYRELTYFQTIASERDAEAFNSAHINSGLRKDNADLTKQVDALRALLRERDEDVERQNGTIGRLESLVDGQAADINGYIKMIEVIEGLPAADDECDCDPDADEECSDCPDPVANTEPDPNVTVTI